MASGTTASGTSPLNAHHVLLKDEATGGRITSSTTRSQLYKYDADGRSIDNDLLRNLVGISEPALRCRLSLDNSVAWPPSLKKSEHGYDFYVAYNKLGYAPCLRLECKFVDPACPNEKPICVVALEFHFNSCDSKRLVSYSFTPAGGSGGARISFKTTGATSSGFYHAALSQDIFSEQQRKIVSLLKSLIVAHSNARPVVIELLASHGEFTKIQQYLPGGNKPLLPTIGVPEYSNFPEHSNFDRDSVLIRKPLEWTRLAIPNPMVPLPACKTYSSLLEYQAQQAVGATMTDWEGSLELQPLRSCLTHDAHVYQMGDFAVLAIDLNRECRIKINGRLQRKIRLPHELEITGTFYPRAGSVAEFRAYHDARMTGLPRHDAFFVVTSHRPAAFSGDISDGSSKPKDKRVHNLKPHQNSFLLSSIWKTIDAIAKEPCRMWRPFVLCQNLDEIEEVDVIENIKISTQRKADAMAWAENAVPWNPEQLKVLKALRHTKGRVIACTGIAGTGKTTLQMVLALLFRKLGGRALCTAPANSNGDHLVRNMTEFAHQIMGLEVRIYRVYSASKGIALKDMTPQQAGHKRAGHKSGNVSHLSGFQYTMWAKKNQDKVTAWDCSVERAVLEEVKKGELKWTTTIQYALNSDETITKIVEVWSEFRKHFERDFQGKFNWNDPLSVREYEALYEKCKGHLLMLADIIITTNGNARAGEFVRYWATASEEFPEIEIKALGLFLDETAKDQEINIWNVITSNGLPKKPDVVVLFGDPKQLPPTNTCSTRPQYNPFAALNDLSLLNRLIGEGFPSINLVEQQRMHPALSKFVNSEFYEGQLRDSPRVLRDLNTVHPGLREALLNILAQSYGEQEDRDKFLEDATDEQLRLQYIEMPNFRRDDLEISERGSIAVTPHIKIFFRKIFPKLQEYFGDKMEEKVMIICGYGMAIKHYDQRIHELQKSSKLPPSHFPRVLTIDASQGQEASMIIVDGSMRFSDTMGFMKGTGRSNVAMTRAKDVLWILGGTLEKLYDDSVLEPSPPFLKLKKELETTGQVHKFS